MSKVAKNRTNINNFTSGILTSSAELALFFIYSEIQIATLPHFIKSLAPKKTFYNLKEQGLIHYRGEVFDSAQITPKGLQRIKNKIPTYQKIRPWEGRIHLVSYDIPEKRRDQRDMLRNYLKEENWRQLQGSVWISPLNKQKELRRFVTRNGLGGSIIISDFGRKEVVGEEKIPELISRVYKLDKLEKRYHDFNTYLQLVRQKNSGKNLELYLKLRLLFTYLAILADDPQLPFQTLPRNWERTKAHRRIKKLWPTNIIIR